MRCDPLAHLFPGLGRPTPVALKREEGPDTGTDHDGDTADDDVTIPPRRDRRPTDGNKGFRNDTGRRRDRRSIHSPQYAGGRLV